MGAYFPPVVARFLLEISPKEESIGVCSILSRFVSRIQVADFAVSSESLECLTGQCWYELTYDHQALC